MSQLFSTPLTSQQTAPHPTGFFFHPTQTFLSAFVFHTTAAPIVWCIFTLKVPKTPSTGTCFHNELISPLFFRVTSAVVEQG